MIVVSKVIELKVMVFSTLWYFPRGFGEREGSILGVVDGYCAVNNSCSSTLRPHARQFASCFPASVCQSMANQRSAWHARRQQYWDPGELVQNPETGIPEKCWRGCWHKCWQKWECWPECWHRCWQAVLPFVLFFEDKVEVIEEQLPDRVMEYWSRLGIKHAIAQAELVPVWAALKTKGSGRLRQPRRPGSGRVPESRSQGQSSSTPESSSLGKP